MEKLLVVNKKKKRWSAHLEIDKTQGESQKYGGFQIKIIDQWEEEPEQTITLDVYHNEALELINALIYTIAN